MYVRILPPLSTYVDNILLHLMTHKNPSVAAQVLSWYCMALQKSRGGHLISVEWNTGKDLVE